MIPPLLIGIARVLAAAGPAMYRLATDPATVQRAALAAQRAGVLFSRLRTGALQRCPMVAQRIAALARARWDQLTGNSAKLIYDATTKTWTSPAGLVYGEGSAHGNRVLHVLAHTKPDLSKPAHTVFNVQGRRVFELLDQAWLRRGAHSVHGQSGNWNYTVEMGRVVGTSGETAVNIAVRPGTSEIVTAFPIK